MGKSAVADEIAEAAITWFARLRADDVSDRDRERFFAWLRAGPEHQQAFVEVLQLWEGMAVIKGMALEELAPFPPLAEFKRRVEQVRS